MATAALALARADEPGSQEPVTFRIEDGQTLAGTLHLPEGDGPFPAVVVLHGASGGLRDHPLYDHLARTLNRAGAAVFVYDRRDEHLPRAERVHPGYMAHGRDAIAALRAIGSRPDIDANRIGLWGVSQGGWTAPAAYVQAPDEIAFLILVSSSGVGPAGQMEHAVRHVLEAEGYDPDIVETGVRIRAASHAYYRGEIPRETAQSLIDAHKDEPWYTHLYMGARLPDSVEGTGWANEVAFEPRPVFSRVRVPTILFYGENDPWIPVEDSMRIWREAAAEAGNDRVRIHRVARTGHAMIIDEPANVDSSTVGPDDFSKDYAQLMQAFLRSVVLP